MALEKISRAIKTDAAEKNVVKTGYIDLDYMMGGLKSGETYLICGTQGVGKTTFACNLAKNICIDRGQRVVYFSNGTSPDKLVEYPFQLLLSEKDFGQFCEVGNSRETAKEHCLNELEAAEFYMDDTSKSIMEIEDALADFQQDISLIIVDSLTCLTELKDSGWYDLIELFESTKYLEVVMCMMKYFAEKYDCPVVMLAESSASLWDLNLPGQGKMLADYYSRNLQNCPDNILYMNQKIDADEGIEASRKMAFHIIKAKRSKTGTVFLGWAPELGTFRSL